MNPSPGSIPRPASRIISAIVNEYRAGEQTIILSTHQVGETETIFDEVLFLREGQIALQDSAENLRQQHGTSIQDLWGRVYH